MNLRLFLLIAMTALFAALWSSDRQYQETEMLARAARRAADAPKMAMSGPSAPASECTPSRAVSPFAASSWVAANFAPPTVATETREPIVAPRVVREDGAVPLAPSVNARIAPVVAARSVPAVWIIVSFTRPSFRLDEASFVMDLPAADTSAEANRTTERDGFARMIGRVRFEIEGQTCWLRWQVRRNVACAHRRLIAFLAQPFDWADLVRTLARAMPAPMEKPAANAARPAASEAR